MGLIVRGRESRIVRLVVEFEAAVLESPIADGRKIERVRDDEGQWIATKTVTQRLRRLGGRVVGHEVTGPGEHTPNY